MENLIQPLIQTLTTDAIWWLETWIDDWFLGRVDLWSRFLQQFARALYKAEVA